MDLSRNNAPSERVALAKAWPYPGDSGVFSPSSSQPVHPLIRGQDLQDRESSTLCKEEGGRQIGEEGQTFGKRCPFSPYLK